ncbi:ABC transporter ATP-binding protein [Schleiferilactobacillus perolens]|jgi:ATP-binding cassette subfamily B protein|uniref:ABC transporter ATP-binding protein n=1 Tax=Schleiferilactobacillus perolens TaxID=100468 RepID=UPI0023527041|nr:ABC transporter ATP-binding protein [Schleiferilactobacillus perolens]MCI2171030.1 ABC transporter ATP-binding protein/permease [Schleiferilactobacillus perolens]
MTINFRWVLRHLPLWLIAALIITAICGSLEGIINGVVLGQFPSLVGASSAKLIRYLLTSSTLYLFTYTFLYLCQILTVVAIKHLNIALKQSMLTVSFQQGEATSHGLNHLTNDAAKIETNYFSALATLLTAICGAVLATTFVLSVHLLMGAIAIAFSALTMIPMVFAQKKIGKLGKDWSQANDQTVQTANDWLAGRREIKQYRTEQSFFARVTGALSNSERRLQKQNIFQWTVQYGSWLLVIAAMMGPWAIGFYLMQHGGFGISISILLTLTLSADHVVGSIRQVMAVWGDLASTKDLRKLQAAPAPFPQVADHISIAPALTLHQASLAFGDHQILRPTTVTIPYGSKVLLTGPSGVGKTSCLNLLAGWQQPTTGKVDLGNTPVQSTDVTYVSQDPWLFNGTIRDNLTLTAHYSDKELLAVLQEVGLLAELGPDPLSRVLHPDANDLSGGQKQRLVIARALLRRRPVLLLDEITAGLDDKNAHAVRGLLYRLPQTIVESAHHLDPVLIQKFHFQTYHLQDQQLVLAD